MVVAIGLAMGYRPEGGPAGVLAAVALLLLFSFSLAWIWTALALVVHPARSPTSACSSSSR